jgi:HlyD family secretion protein
MNDVSTPPVETIDEFLGTTERPRWRRWAKYWVPALIVLVLLIIVLSQRGGNKTDYITEPVTRQALSLTVTATGNLRPTNQVQVGSEVSGRIDSVLVDVNDRVARGQVLARINTDVIEDQIRQAQADLNSAHASVAQAGATLDVDSAQLARLQEVYRLSAGKVPSKTELEAAEANVKRDRASVASAQASVARAQAALSSSITNRDRAVIRSPVAGVVLARQVEPGQTVAASFNTPTLFVLAEDLSAMQLRVNVDEADVGQVHAGQKAEFTVDAYPGREFPATVERIDLASTNTASTAASGTSSQAAAGQSNSVVNYEARLSVANPDGLLRPGMTATASIATGKTGVSLLVPNGALRFNPGEAAKAQQASGGGGLSVQVGLQEEQQKATIGVGSRQEIYVLKDDGTLDKIDVVVGQSNGRLTAVTSSRLKPGMKVVTGIKAKNAKTASS